MKSGWNRWIRLGCALGCALGAMGTGALAGEAARSAAAQDPSSASSASQPPDSPRACLERAEDLADRATDAPDGDALRAQAIELAARAGAMDLEGYGRSAALFIADVSRDAALRERMKALAAVLGGQEPTPPQVHEPVAVLGLARAFAAYKRGQGARARAALDGQGVAALLDAHPEIMPGGSARFRADCAAMREGVAPPLSIAQQTALDVLVAAALAPAPRTWSESLALYGRAPFPDVDLGDPAVLFALTPSPAPAPDPPAGPPDAPPRRSDGPANR